MRGFRRRGLRLSRRSRLRLIGLLVLAAALFVLLYLTPQGMRFVTDLAVNAATEMIRAKINAAVQDVIRDTADDAYYSYQTDAGGRVSAVSVNVNRVNETAAALLAAALETEETNHTLSMEMPVETLLGANILFGTPTIPVRVLLLTTSHVDYHNEFSAAAINQSKYQLFLHITVNIDVILPWGRDEASVESDVLLAETVIIGDVPGTYLEVE